MDILILSIFAIVVVLSFVEDYMPSWQKIPILIGICICMVCIAGFKPLSTTDARTYEYYYYFNYNPIIELATEPTYIYLSRLFVSFGWKVGAIFLAYAIMAIPMKLVILWKTTPYIFTALIVYVGIYYPLHDVVQIRCGVAVGFLLWAMIPLAKRHYFKATVLTICAILFHYSSVAFLPLLVVGNMRIGKYWKYLLASAVPICLALYVMGFSAVSFIPNSLVEGKLDLYRDMSETGNLDEYVPYKQIPFFAEFILLYFFIFFYETIEKYCVYAPILIKILVLELACMIMFAEIPVLGARLHELFGMFNVIAYTCCLYCIKPRYVARIGITLFCFAFYLHQMLYHLYFH